MRHVTLADRLREVGIAPALLDRLPRTILNLGGGRPPFTFVLGNVVGLSNAVETILATLPPLNPGLDAANVLLLAYFGVPSVGTGTTALVPRIRQGTTATGTVVNTALTKNSAAGNNEIITMVAIDTPGAVAGMQYVLTCTATGATGGTNPVNSVFIGLALG